MIAFTDDDCRPSSGWLASLLAAAAATPGALIVQGRVSPDPDEIHLLTGLARSLTVDGADGWFPTANLALPRSLLRELGGFDETLAYGEDTDLGLRGTAAGARAVFAPEALVWHAVHTRNILSARGDTARAAEVAKVIRRHPAQRKRIFLRLFWKRSHAMALLALAGICMARRRPLAAALAVAPYAIENYDTGVAPSTRHLAAVAASMPARLLLDLRETAATVAGAIRVRTPLV